MCCLKDLATYSFVLPCVSLDALAANTCIFMHMYIIIATVDTNTTYLAFPGVVGSKLPNQSEHFWSCPVCEHCSLYGWALNSGMCNYRRTRKCIIFIGTISILHLLIPFILDTYGLQYTLNFRHHLYWRLGWSCGHIVDTLRRESNHFSSTFCIMHEWSKNSLDRDVNRYVRGHRNPINSTVGSQAGSKTHWLPIVLASSASENATRVLMVQELPKGRHHWKAAILASIAEKLSPE